MSYQSYLSNLNLQQSLQDSFAQAQTTNDQDAFEEVEDDNSNKVAIANTKDEEKEQADEEGAMSLTASLFPASDIKFGASTLSELGNKAIGSVASQAKSAVSDLVDSAKEGFSSAVDTATNAITARIAGMKSQFTASAENVQNQLGAFTENTRNVIGNSITDGSSRIGTTDQEYLLNGDPEILSSSVFSGSTAAGRFTPNAPQEIEMSDLGPTSKVVAPDAVNAPALAAPAVAEGGEVGEGLSAAIGVGADIPFLNIGLALGGIGYGLYELFHHSSTPSMPPPPPAPIAAAQNVSTTQAGV